MQTDGRCSSIHIRFLERGADGRTELESFIHGVYARTYGADIDSYLPLLVGLFDGNDAPLAGMGLRPAADERLFLETYLDAPAEAVIAARMGEPVDRSRLVELGNLAAGTPGSARMMIVALNAILAGSGYEWAAFTAVPAVYNAFTRLGLPLNPLAEADGHRLGPDLARWGLYYEHRPVVVAGKVRLGYEALDRLIRVEEALAVVGTLWQQAHAAGIAHAILQQ